MKYSKLTYYLLAILCVMATSCVTDGVMDDCSINDKSQAQPIEGGKVNFALTFPTTSTRGITDTSDGLVNERTVNDVQIYTFVRNQFIEKVKYVLISGANGDVTRFVEGKLLETYTSNTAMDFVVIVNAESKGVQNISMNSGDNKADLYEQLLFNYNKDYDWSTDIPMWGEGRISSVKSGENNIGELTLKRAIAKVNVTVANGQGLKDFEITKIQLHNYNTQGYCAPINSDGPSIPETSNISKDFLTSGTLSGGEGNKFENKFYIPEHLNIGVQSENKVYLTITATVKSKTGVKYTIPFSENSTDYNVLRNYIYVFNITNVKMDIDVTSTLEYEVKAWNEETVDIPSFN